MNVRFFFFSGEEEKTVTFVSKSEPEPVQRFFSFPPVRLATGQQGVECLGVVVVFKVAELMHDDVLYAMHGYLNQFDIECDTARRTATSPPSTHGPDDQ